MIATQVQPRRLPRFSLITLLVAVNVAGVLVWANLRNQEEPPFALWPTVLVGWPLQYAQKPTRSPIIDSFLKDIGIDWMDENMDTYTWFEWTPLLGDIVICLRLTVATGLLTEFTVRRIRKAKRHDG